MTQYKVIFKIVKSLKIIFLFLLVVVCAYIVRNVSYRREIERINKDIEMGLKQANNFAPFLVESSMMYSYAMDVASGEGIPKYDNQLTGMSKVPVSHQFTNGLEYVLGHSYGIKNKVFGETKYTPEETQFEDDPDFSRWCSTNIRIWASIISGLIFLWLVTLKLPLLFAFFGGLLHALATGAIPRYTGQDIVRGNLALPLIVATFFMAYVFLSKPQIGKLVIFGVVAFFALATWDMTQIVFAIWGLSEIQRLACKQQPKKTIKFGKRQKLWTTIALATLLAAFLVPYHRAHMLVVSPLMLIIFPVIFIMHNFGKGELPRRLIVLAIAIIGCFFTWWGILSLGSFAGNYGHFASLMKAKIYFLNVKPANPDLLDFDARSIWVPAMHSANKYIFKAFFPLAFNFTLILLVLTLWLKKMRRALVSQMGMFNFPLFMFVFYGLAFFFIVRYHVFTIIFIAILLPLLFHLWVRNSLKLKYKDVTEAVVFVLIYFIIFNVYLQINPNRSLAPKMVIVGSIMPVLGLLVTVSISTLISWVFGKIRKTHFPREVFVKVSFTIIAIILLMTELDGSLFSIRQYGKKNFFAETAGLIKWFRQQEMADEVVMGDFEISPLLKAYCNSKIVLQPKFELGKTRENYQQFMEIMFHKTEKELASFCAENNAKYFIFDRGYPEAKGLYSPRYIAAAKELKGDSPANMMNTSQTRELLRNFYEIKPPRDLKIINTRYIVFQVISEADKKRAAKWVAEAENEFARNNKSLAKRLAKAAIFADPLSPEGYLLYRQLFGKPPQVTLRRF